MVPVCFTNSPAKTTKTDAAAVLGKPWRTTDFGNIDGDEGGPRGTGSLGVACPDSRTGPYCVHIEFNEEGVVNVARFLKKRHGPGACRPAFSADVPSPPPRRV